MKRYDGRSPDELRPISIELDFTQNPAGSVLIRSGKTMVLCTATLEKGVPGWLRGAGKGWVTAEYSMLPGSTDTRSEREASRGKVSGRTQEIQRLIGRSLRASIDLAALGERSIYVDCDVLQADGGTRTAAITGGWVALAQACNRLVSAGQLAKSPIVDSVAAISVGIVDGVCLLDLPYPEDSRAEVDMNVVRTGTGRLIEVQGTGEGGTFDRKLLDQMLDLAEKGLTEIGELQRRAVAPTAK